MIGFLLKKTFFDLWDNLFRVALLNIGFLISAAIPAIGPSFFVSVPTVAFSILILGALWCFVYLAASAGVLKNISDYGSFGFSDFFAALRSLWPAGLLLGSLALLLSLLASTALPFYFTMKSPVGIFAAALVFWTIVVIVLAFQYFLAIRVRLDRDYRKVVKKCFLVFFDNPGLSVFAAIHNLAILILSAFLAFLLPGPAGVLLFLDEAFRLRLLKYDYLDSHPEADRRRIPWDELLAEERENTGTRTLKNFIFPWKY